MQIKQFFNNVVNKTNNFEEGKEEEQEEYFSNFYNINSAENLSTLDLLNKLDTLILEESRKMFGKRLVNEDAFQEIYDELRIKILTSTSSTSQNKNRVSFTTDEDLKRAREYSTQIKELSNKYCVDSLEKVEDLLKELQKEIDTNKKEFVV